MMGYEHINNLKLMPEAEIAGICDPMPQSIQLAQAFLGDGLKDKVTVYPDRAAMLADPKIDAVLISSPNFTHAEVLRDVVKSGKHVLCEKPLATTLEDVHEIRALAQAHKAIREHRFPFLKKVGDWNRFSKNTGGTMVEKCCHFFDLMRLIVKAKPTRVYCSGAMDVNHLDERYDGKVPDIIDNSYTVIDFDNGVRAMLDLCMFAEGSKNQEEIAAVGDTGKLEVFIPDGDLVFSPRSPRKPVTTHVAVDDTALKAGTHHGASYYQHQAFLRAVLGGGPVEVTVDDGYWAVIMGMAAEISAKEKRAVAISELAA
jgi:myo-inositol 2-dehydrogenase/D-chiro-inositol 1-dehydrogenase